jgi:hypothetical protein
MVIAAEIRLSFVCLLVNVIMLLHLCRRNFLTLFTLSGRKPVQLGGDERGLCPPEVGRHL